MTILWVLVFPALFIALVVAGILGFRKGVRDGLYQKTIFKKKTHDKCDCKYQEKK